MSLHHSDFIEYIFSSFGFKSYLELGLYHGETILKVKKHADVVVGVDMVDNKIEGIEFNHMTTEEFFKTNTKTFDVIFIDANHDFLSVRYDGIIFLHDTDPEREELLQSGYCSDCYKITEYIARLEQLTQITLPIAEAGLTMVRRRNDRRIASLQN